MAETIRLGSDRQTIPGFSRTSSGAIVNMDDTGYKDILDKRAAKRALGSVNNKIENLENSLNEIKDILKAVLHNMPIREGV